MSHRRLASLAVVAVAALSACGPAKPAATSALPSAPVAPSSSSATVASPSPSASSGATPSVTPSATPTPGETATATSSPDSESSTTSATSSAAAPAPNSWDMRTNARFGYAAPVPPGWAIAGDPANGDGFTATGPDGATVTYSGANVMADPNVSDAPCKTARDALAQRGVAISYAVDTASTCVLTGTVGDRVVYERLWIGQGSRVAMLWDYPAADKSSVDPLVEQAGKSLRPGDLNRSH